MNTRRSGLAEPTRCDSSGYPMPIEPPLVVVVQVLAVNQQTETTVTGTGGGGFTYQGTGFTVPLNVQTQHEHWSEVWVRRPDGTEDRLDFSGVDFPVRRGHRLALLMSGSEIWAAKNFTLGRTTSLVDADHLTGHAPSGLKLLGNVAATFYGLLLLHGFILGWRPALGETPAAEFIAVALILGLPLWVWQTGSKHRIAWRKNRAAVDQMLADAFAALGNA